VVGGLLDKLDELGSADDTIVIVTTDNGAENFWWPDGGTFPFRGAKGLGWEGGFRAPFVMRWPGRIPPGRLLNGIVSLEDVVPTIMAAAGVPDIKEQLLQGYQAGEKQFRVYLDGYDQLPYLTGQTEESPWRTTAATSVTSGFRTWPRPASWSTPGGPAPSARAAMSRPLTSIQDVDGSRDDHDCNNKRDGRLDEHRHFCPPNDGQGVSGAEGS
jgi:arylsulfatase A-like enzyme